jgi:hypothetical protein
MHFPGTQKLKTLVVQQASVSTLSLLFGCICVSLFYSVTHSTAQSRMAADILFVNGHIFTASPAQPWVEGVAVRDGRS